MNSSAFAWRRMRAVCFVAACAVALVPAAALAQSSDTGEILITVTDATTSKPVGDARTILVGPQTASSLTTASGIIHYTDVPIGIYRVRVVKPGFAQGVSKEFDVLSDRSVDVRVTLALATGGLKVIGTVTARSNVSISSNDIADNSPIRRLSDSLTDALDKIAGVSVTQDATDPNGPVTVSLNGHDESQTSVSLDGIPLSAPGSTANLRAIGTDLFSGSSVSTAPGAGSLGGGVNFRTLQPTQALQVKSSATTGTFDRSNEQFAATGSVGSLGIAVEHTDRDANSPLTFQDYEDQSGLTYPHGGESQSIGDFLKLRYRLNDDRTSISATALTNNQHNFAICAQDVTALPCGIGPNNENYSRYGFAYGTIQSLVGTVATQVTAYTSAGTSNVDDAARYALLPNPTDDANASDLCTGGLTGIGAPGTGTAPVYTPLDPSQYVETACPSLSTNRSLTRGLAYSASISQGRHTFAFSGNTYSAFNSSVPLAGSLYERAFTTAISSTSYQLSDAYKVSDTLTLSPRISLANTTTLGTSLLGGISAAWRPHAQDTYGASVSLGSSQPNININRSYSDPVSARFDCRAGIALVNGPGDTNGGAQSAVTFDANWTHQFVRSGSQVSLDAFSQVQSGQLITANIEEPVSSGYFPAGYLQTLYNVYASPTVCGTSAAAPAVFVAEPVGGTRRVYQGINASGRIAFGRYVVALPTYTLNVAELTAASARLNDGASTTIVGAQLPNRPLHRAGLTLDGLLPRSGIELLGNAQYTGANNQQNLGPYVTVAAGVSHGLGPGIVTLFENNVFNTYGGIFATDAFDRPLALSTGGSLRTIATPLLPRTVSLSYTLNIGGPRPALALGAVSNRALAQATPAPVASAAAGRGGGGGGLGRLTAVPPPPGVDPLALATTRDSCTVDAQSAATPVLAALRAYVTAYEANASPPPVDGFTITAHRLAAGASVPYYLELRPNLRPPGSRAGNASQPDAVRLPGGRGGFGGGGNGGEGGPGGPGVGGPGGGPGAEGGPPGEASGGGTVAAPTQAERDAFRNSPAFKAFRGFSACSYVTVLTSAAAKGKGIDLPGRPGLIYVPGTGFVFVRPPELPQGGGSLKGAQ